MCCEIFSLSLNSESWAVEGKLCFWISFSAQFSVKFSLKPLLCLVGPILGPFVLFTHFLEHLFSPIMGRFEESSMGLSILGNQYLVNYSSGLYKITDGSKEKMEPRGDEISY